MDNWKMNPKNNNLISLLFLCVCYVKKLFLLAKKREFNEENIEIIEAQCSKYNSWISDVIFVFVCNMNMLIPIRWSYLYDVNLYDDVILNPIIFLNTIF